VKLVVALGGNALLRRDETPSLERQRRNVARASRSIADLAERHDLVLTHGNGPQVGMLAMQGGSGGAEDPDPLDVLGAESEGMIGYLLAQELGNVLPDRPVASLLTQVVVDREDPAFDAPTKPIGGHVEEEEKERLTAARGWSFRKEGEGWRRVVPSPEPRRILEVDVVRMLSDRGVLVVCAGGGGIPVVRDERGGFVGVEAVIDKDRTAALLADALEADGLLLLTDVDGVYRDWEGPAEARIDRLTAKEAEALALDEGSMGPKVAACLRFLRGSSGAAAPEREGASGRRADARFAAIGALEEAQATSVE